MCFVAPVGFVSRWPAVGPCWSPATLQAAPTSEQLLPSTTKGYVSVGDVDRFRADWAKTQIGQLLDDPIMQPFVEDFKKQLAGQVEPDASEAGHHLG